MKKESRAEAENRKPQVGRVMRYMKKGSRVKAIWTFFGLLFLVAWLSIGQGSVPANPKVVGEPVIVEPGKRGGQLTVLAEPMQGFNPYVGPNTATNLMNAGLLELNPVTLLIEPALAEAFEVAPDGKTITFTLRRVNFSDGKPLTADDVLFTFKDVLLNPRVSTDLLKHLREDLTVEGQLVIEDVEKLGELSVRFKLRRPFAPLLRRLTELPVLPKHKLAGKDLSRAWGLAAKPEDFAGLGPFRLKSFDAKKATAILERNPFYWKVDTKGSQLPYLDELALKFVEPAKVAEKLGELDLAFQRVDFVTVKAKDAQVFAAAAEKSGFRLLQVHDTGVAFLTFNQDVPDMALRQLFRDVRFRQAVAHLIDREAIIKEALQGFGFAQEGPLLTVSPFFSPQEVVKFPFSLERANALLDELGLRERTREGFRRLPDGKVLTIELITNDNNEARVRMGPLLVKVFAQAGIKLEFKPIPFETLLARIGLRAARPNYEAVIVGFSAGTIFPEDWESVFTSDGRNHYYKFSDAEGNDVPEYQKRLDELFQKQTSEYDFGKRRALFAEFQRLVTVNLPLIFLVNRSWQVAIRPQIGNASVITVVEFATGLLETLWRKDQ